MCLGAHDHTHCADRKLLATRGGHHGVRIASLLPLSAFCRVRGVWGCSRGSWAAVWVQGSKTLFRIEVCSESDSGLGKPLRTKLFKAVSLACSSLCPKCCPNRPEPVKPFAACTHAASALTFSLSSAQFLNYLETLNIHSRAPREGISDRQNSIERATPKVRAIFTHVEARRGRLLRNVEGMLLAVASSRPGQGKTALHDVMLSFGDRPCAAECAETGAIVHRSGDTHKRKALPAASIDGCFLGFLYRDIYPQTPTEFWSR